MAQKPVRHFYKVLQFHVIPGKGMGYDDPCINYLAKQYKLQLIPNPEDGTNTTGLLQSRNSLETWSREIKNPEDPKGPKITQVCGVLDCFEKITRQEFLDEYHAYEDYLEKERKENGE